MTDTAEKIIEAALQCFFQHGFSRSNMSMIAEYAGCSRVTLYKYFKTKEDLFRHISLRFLRERVAEFEDLLKRDLTFWHYLEAIIASYVVSPFEEVGNDIILNDLVSAAGAVVPDVHDERDRQLAIFLNRIIENASRKGEIRLDLLDVRPDELAELISLMMNGMVRIKVENIRDQSRRMISVLRRALQPSGHTVDNESR